MIGNISTKNIRITKSNAETLRVRGIITRSTLASIKDTYIIPDTSFAYARKMLGALSKFEVEYKGKWEEVTCREFQKLEDIYCDKYDTKENDTEEVETPVEEKHEEVVEEIAKEVTTEPEETVEEVTDEDTVEESEETTVDESTESSTEEEKKIVINRKNKKRR